MPKISTERRQCYRARIRSVIAQHPQISQVTLAERLNAEGLDLDRKYLGSLLNATAQQAAEAAEAAGALGKFWEMHALLSLMYRSTR
jgi:hypothetical protein